MNYQAMIKLLPDPVSDLRFCTHCRVIKNKRLFKCGDYETCISCEGDLRNERQEVYRKKYSNKKEIAEFERYNYIRAVEFHNCLNIGEGCKYLYPRRGAS